MGVWGGWWWGLLVYIYLHLPHIRSALHHTTHRDVTIERLTHLAAGLGDGHGEAAEVLLRVRVLMRILFVEWCGLMR